jgi:hypothetical protein
MAAYKRVLGSISMTSQQHPEPLTLLAATLLGCGVNLILAFCTALCWGLIGLTYATSPDAPADMQALYSQWLVGVWGVPVLVNGAVLAVFGLRRRWDVVRGFLIAFSATVVLLGAGVFVLARLWLSAASAP